MEIGWHLVQQDEDRLVAFKEVEPIPFVRRFRAAVPKDTELFPLPQLVGDFTPEEVIGVVTAVESGNVGTAKGVGVGDAGGICLPQFRMSGQ